MQTKIPCVLMRGGTSRGPIFHSHDLPSDPATRDRVLLRAMGSPDAKQIDGIGGATTVTSKVAILSPSDHEWAQIDYLFAQVAINDAVVDTSPSCGNMMAAVAPYAIEEGLVPAVDGETTVRIRNVNTNSLIEATVKTPGGHVTYEGDTAISGVPGTGSPIYLRLRDIVGAKTGKFLPTGNRRDVINGVNVTCMDVAMQMVFVPAPEVGKTGHESKAELDGDADLLQCLEALRRAAAEAMGMGDVQGKVIPKIALVAEPRSGGHMASRYFTPWTAHPSYAVLGSICAASCAATPDTVANDIVRSMDVLPQTMIIEHPSGIIEVGVDIDMADGGPQVTASIVRTARRLFAGYIYVPDSVWANEQSK
jgi:4-oxalomesaconate tautomerase